MDISNYKISIWRRIVQIIAFIVINYVIIEAIFSINLKSFEVFLKALPFLNSPRNPLSKGAGFVEYLFYSMAKGEFPFFIIALFLLFILFTNRFFCGWICPIGTIQDGLSTLGAKNKTVKKETHENLLKFKYFLIVLLLIIIVPLGITKTTDIAFHNDYKENLGSWAEQPVGFFSLSEYIFVFFPNLMTEIFENWEQTALEPLFSDFWVFFFFLFYLIVIMLAIFYPRVYCKYMCPFGAIAARLSRYSFLKLTRSPVRCVGRADCGICERVCPKQVRILDEPYEFFTGNGECNLCLRCKEKCPHNAIDIRFG
ncbi:MAG: 4Fe-4S binding protein [Promethearchaeota archaeon]|nr:MAG: 4Fe-4S binding protein [Candidatus Lokiarchaeota archaeon]